MMKAFQDVAGRENVKNITVCFSIENGLYVEVEGRVTLSQELLDRVKAEMKRLSEQDLPLQKRSENTDEAMDHFQEQGMYDKARLFNYRRASRVNVYRLGDYDDYFSGYMVMSTRYLKYFDLQMYEEGFILRLPNKKQPKAIQPFHPQKKLFDVGLDHGARRHVFCIHERQRRRERDACGKCLPEVPSVRGGYRQE